MLTIDLVSDDDTKLIQKRGKDVAKWIGFLVHL